MTALYALYKNPPKDGNKEQQPLHARIVPGPTIQTSDLCKVISECTSFSSADVKGLLKALSDWMAYYLEEGRGVELEGIGHFSVSLHCPPIMQENEIRAESITFSKVNFRCSTELKSRLKDMPLERKPHPKKEIFTEKQRKERILAYLDEHRCIYSSTCISINQISKYQAIKDLNEMIEAGIIEKLGHGKSVLYIRKNNDSI